MVNSIYFSLIPTLLEASIILRLSWHPWKAIKQPRRFQHQHNFPPCQITGVLFVPLWWQQLSTSIILCMSQKENWIRSDTLASQRHHCSGTFSYYMKFNKHAVKDWIEDMRSFYCKISAVLGRLREKENLCPSSMCWLCCWKPLWSLKLMRCVQQLTD